MTASPKVVASALLMGILVGLPCAWLYAWFDYKAIIGFYVKGIAVSMFGGIVGTTIEAFLTSRKCRSVVVAGAIAFSAAAISYYFCWAVWLHAATGVTTLECLHPSRMISLILTQPGDRVLLWSARILEAGCIFGWAIYFSTHPVRDSVAKKKGAVENRAHARKWRK